MLHLTRDEFASMRPRVFPAEDFDRHIVSPLDSYGFNEAAGIPRGRLTPVPPHGGCATSFNEAAGIPRGRRLRRQVHTERVPASMRPRVFPAEDGPLATPCDQTMLTAVLRAVGRLRATSGR